jgi:hypothetical protein
MDRPVVAVEVTTKRLDELIRWHGTDESDLPPPSTLEYLSRDTVAALRELMQLRVTVGELRATMGRAFWAQDLRALHRLLLEGLGPPPEEDPAIQIPLPNPTYSLSSDPRRED